MDVHDTRLDGVKLIKLAVYQDARGYFLESFQARRYRGLLGVGLEFVQDNSSYSTKNVIRGLHYQLRHPQGKLIRVLQGRIIDVTVDVRRDSPQFGCAQAITMSFDDFNQLWVPPGYAHGFAVVSDTALVDYKCTDFYVPGDEVCLRWDDPALGIAWSVASPLLSDKDRNGSLLSELLAAGRVF